MSEADEWAEVWNQTAPFVAEGVCPTCKGRLTPGVVEGVDCGRCATCGGGWRLYQYDGDGHPLWKRGEMLVERLHDLPPNFRRFGS